MRFGAEGSEPVFVTEGFEALLRHAAPFEVGQILDKGDIPAQHRQEPEQQGIGHARSQQLDEAG